MSYEQVVDVVVRAMARKGWSVKRTAEECDVARTFLNRFLDPTGKPPRVREGRLTADQDPRYATLARKLGLDVDDFVASVVALQTGTDRPSDASIARLVGDVWRAVRGIVDARDKDWLAPLLEEVVRRATTSQGLARWRATMEDRYPRLDTPDGRSAYQSMSDPERQRLDASRDALVKLGDAIVIEGPPELLGTRTRVASALFDLSQRRIEPADFRAS
ncbi:MAG: hypothetical protein H6704_04425 [Myxococcales bacterium]|nr:hypothetical protein [Myxococcales bacterium]MCB9535489.1 hypothetical protein [Myxococcales bacterium]